MFHWMYSQFYKFQNILKPNACELIRSFLVRYWTFFFVIGVDDDFQADCHIIEHENMNSASGLQISIDEYKMISDVQLISDDNANDDDSLCGSFYSGEYSTNSYCLNTLIEYFQIIHEICDKRLSIVAY